MKRFVLTLSAVAILALLANSQTISESSVIEAAKFPSLQAAFDAVPTNGGVVLLPPGTFKLVLR